MKRIKIDDFLSIKVFEATGSLFIASEASGETNVVYIPAYLVEKVLVAYINAITGR